MLSLEEGDHVTVETTIYIQLDGRHPLLKCFHCGITVVLTDDNDMFTVAVLDDMLIEG